VIAYALAVPSLRRLAITRSCRKDVPDLTFADMNRSLSLLLLFLLPVAFCAAGCTKKAPSIEWVDPQKVTQGPIIHPKLSDEQLTRISRLQQTFKDADPMPLAKWIEDFSRDQDPDREIKIWEGMALPYEQFLAKHTLSPQGKKDAFQVVMLRSGASAEEAMRHLKLQELTENDAREILSSYQEAPEPIRIYNK